MGEIPIHQKHLCTQCLSKLLVELSLLLVWIKLVKMRSECAINYNSLSQLLMLIWLDKLTKTYKLNTRDFEK